MAEGSEMKGFVFCVVYILVFTAFVSSIPTGLLGGGGTPSDIVAIDPNIITGFTESENYTPAAYNPVTGWYEYTLGVNSFVAQTDDAAAIGLFAKVLFLTFWFGQVDPCIFSIDTEDRGITLTFTEIAADAPEGIATYDLKFSDAGVSAGSLIIYWNITTYPAFANAWAADEVYLLHGIGFAESATNDAGALLIGLLTLQIPEVPTLVNIIIIAPLWASIVYVIWFIVKEMIPFVG